MLSFRTTSRFTDNLLKLHFRVLSFGVRGGEGQKARKLVHFHLIPYPLPSKTKLNVRLALLAREQEADLFEANISANKIGLAQGQSYTERDPARKNQSIVFTRCVDLCIQRFLQLLTYV